MQRPSICFVAPHVYPIASQCVGRQFAGGAEVQQNFISRGLASRGYRVSILAGDYGQPDEVEIEGVRFIKLRQGSSSFPVVRYFHPRLTALWAGMARANADIYFQRCAAAATFVTGLFAKTHRRRFIFSAAHDLDLHRPRTKELFLGRGGWRDRQLFYRGIGLADIVVAQHQGQVDDAKRWHSKDAVYVPSCYLPKQSAVSANKRVVLWVSVLRRWKRPELFIQIAKMLPHLKFRMIGGPSSEAGDPAAHEYFDQMKAFASSLPNVEFVGFLPYREADTHFDDAVLFVNTSDYEGFPNTFLQAWARGVPTVSFFDSGASDESGAIGRVVRDLNEMQQSISDLTSDASKWKVESERCATYFLKQHSLESVVDLYTGLIDQMGHQQ